MYNSNRFFLPILISRLRHIPVYAVNYFFGELINLFLKIGSFSHCDGRRRYTTGQTGMRRHTGICRNGSYEEERQGPDQTAGFFKARII